MTQFELKVGTDYTIEDFPEPQRSLLMACHHSGACDSDVKAAEPYFTIDDPDGLREHLKQYAAWDDDEMLDDQVNLGRLLWLMAADIQETGSAYIID